MRTGRTVTVPPATRTGPNFAGQPGWLDHVRGISRSYALRAWARASAALSEERDLHFFAGSDLGDVGVDDDQAVRLRECREQV